MAIEKLSRVGIGMYRMCLGRKCSMDPAAYRVDILFIHNPEYFLMDKIKSSNENVKGYQNQMLDRISQSFETMEEAIQKGQILSYGISSNSFSLAEDDKHFFLFMI
ncbi:uncharacterized protein OCT59_001020 [Rhizophagus irregularis]|uniref:uncharacterized protein n=1 Tax=Rhizophagus irregularis TaxID=588596 RepID=UPI001A0AB5CB|nr:hypothetical protein OCT59_001020 [Rhizophagus irregularis]GBC28669.2 aldo/keto reductase [Rhizophagus irregularis DAOM 181602=DAOM 197198]